MTRCATIAAASANPLMSVAIRGHNPSPDLCDALAQLLACHPSDFRKDGFDLRAVGEPPCV
jgi:hypothetical protein